MLRLSKIKLMTALCMYETGEGKKDIKISKYTKKDYVSLHMLISVIGITIVYLMLIGFVCIIMMGVVANTLSLAMIYLYGVIALIVYFVLVIIGLIYANVYYKKKYNRAKQHTKSYYKGLKQLEKMYQAEDKQIRDGETIKELRDRLGQN